MPGESIKTVAVDASFILAYLLPDEKTPDEKLFAQHNDGEIQSISTYLLPFEVLNSLKCAFKQKRISKFLANGLSRKFFELEIELLPVEFAEVFKLAEKKNLTVYDAGYLWLAKNKKIKLQTLDKQLKKIAS